MAVSFSGVWSDEIASVTGSSEFQTCTIRIDWSSELLTAYDYVTGEQFSVSAVLSETVLDVKASYDAWQLLLSDPDATVEQVEDAFDAYEFAAATLFDVLNIESPGDVFVSTPEPVGTVGDVWIRTVDGVGVVSVYETSWVAVTGEVPLYSGQARFIPSGSGSWVVGDDQLNSTSLHRVRFQVPVSERSKRVPTGSIVTILSAPFNGSLVGRTAKVVEDFQGGSSATRTFHAMMDADSVDS